MNILPQILKISSKNYLVQKKRVKPKKFFAIKMTDICVHFIKIYDTLIIRI